MTYRQLYLLIVTLALIVVLTACSDNLESPVSAVPVTAEKIEMSNIAKMVAHNGNVFFYPTSVEPTGDPLVVHISYEGEGNASHFGRFTETGEYLLHSDAAGTPLFVSNVIARRYTANGDQVFLANVTGVISLTGDPNHPLVLEGDYTYAGGTGRFEGATGSLHWRAVGNPDGSALSNFEGTISTVGSGQ